MKWRIAANGVALVVAISSVAYVASEESVAAATQKFVANDAKSVLASIKVKNEYKWGL